MNKKVSLCIFFLILLLAISLRAQETISHNFLFLLDQGRDMMAVKSILYDHHLTLIGPYTSLQGVFQGPLWYYFLSIPTLLTNGDPWGGVVLMFILSVLSILVTYFFMNKFFGKNAALITVFLFAVSPEAIASATFTWNPHPMWILIVLYIFSFYQVVLHNKKFHLFLWPVISLMFHFQTALGFFILLITILRFIFFDRKEVKTKFFVVGILIAFLFFLPQILFDTRHNFLMTKSILKIFQGKDQGLSANGENNITYLVLVKDHLFSIYSNFKSSFLSEGLLEFFPFAVLLFTIYGVVWRKGILHLTKKEDLFGRFLFSITALFIAITFLYPFQLRPWFLTGFQTMYIICSGLYISKLWEIKFGKFFIILLFLPMVFYSCEKIYNLYANPDYGGVSKMLGKIDAIDYIYKDAQKKEFGLLVFAPPVYADNYDYLIWWYGKKKYGYVPSSQKKGTFYLLIEPDSAKPWSYKGWLETVIKTGRILDTKKLPSGFIIQKRIVEKNEI